MSVLTHDPGVESLHDRVVSLVAQRWARAVQWTITITTDAERGQWSGSERREPDIVVWRPDSGRRVVEWIAEVESEKSLAAPHTDRRWQKGVALGVPFYLFVPKGCRAAASQLALTAGVTLNGLYEYALTGEEFQIW